MLTDRERLILLNAVPDVGSLRLRRLLDSFGDLGHLWQATAQELQQVEGVGPQLAQRLAAAFHDEAPLAEELASAQRLGAHLVTLQDPDYPRLLQAIPDPPLLLYIRGRLPAHDVAVAVVGSRHASLYGLQAAERLAYDLAVRGVTIVSGLARGIDAASHRGALKASGRTLAVLGSGLGCVYPPEHGALADAVVEQGGALVSEYPMSMPPLPHNFPRRNRIISGLSLGVVIVEASQRSGALITADCALEQGREVFAVPGHITTVTSQGTHQLLKQGARLVTSVEDILEELRLTPHPIQNTTQETGTTALLRLPEREQRVFACVSADEPKDIDAIVAHSGVKTAEASSVLLELELKHLVRQLPGKQFVRHG